jgi:hypothetical protein
VRGLVNGDCGCGAPEGFERCHGVVTGSLIRKRRAGARGGYFAAAFSVHCFFAASILG